jgi:CDP-diacylglycerol--glycerol-3-phosphate 3-phosphatidyltransferase
MTFTGLIGAACMYPLRAIIRASVALGIHPNVLTLIGVLINVVAAVALGLNHFLLAGVIMIVANIFDFIDGKVAHITNTVSRFGAFWDSTLDRFSDIALFLGLIYLYADLRRTDYVMIASLAMMFSIMISYARARAESLIEKCKVGFMERPERIVLIWIGVFTTAALQLSNGRRAVGDSGAIGRDRRQPHPLHVSRPQQQAAPRRLERRHPRLLTRVLLARRPRLAAL